MRAPYAARAIAFLTALGAQPRHPFAATDTAVVVAHPDDETACAGGQLPRLRGATVVHVTDGAPRDMADARCHGFRTRDDYAAARRRELLAAMAEAGVPEAALAGVGVPDQQAAFRLPLLAHRLAALFHRRAIRIVLTHPYEGGHPDHDATAFAVHAACALLAARRCRRPAVIDMACYYAGADGGMVAQEFAAPDGGYELLLHLDGECWARKRRMLAAYATQRGSLAPFVSRFERFRPAPDYDFSVLPNGGRLLYERFDWGMTGRRWLALVTAAQRRLATERGR
ncbi:MAG: PIG-L family deacetylase [Rhodospirillaceae bacterium]|nr:PIG-L family deacetylase [Rhodospirillaceae bacterium]